MPKLYYCHGGSIKKTNLKDPIKRIRSKMTCPKWHFGQIKHGHKKKHMGDFIN